jgi:hypothetical protein
MYMSLHWTLVALDPWEVSLWEGFVWEMVPCWRSPVLGHLLFPAGKLYKPIKKPVSFYFLQFSSTPLSPGTSLSLMAVKIHRSTFWRPWLLGILVHRPRLGPQVLERHLTFLF